MTDNRTNATDGDYHEGLEEGIKIGRAERDAVPDAATEKLREAAEADRIRLGHLQDEVYRLEAERDAAVAAIERVRAVHIPEGWPLYGGGESKEYCSRCNCRWPCETIAALDGAPNTNGSNVG